MLYLMNEFYLSLTIFRQFQIPTNYANHYKIEI